MQVKITFREEDIEIKFDPEDTLLKFAGKWDILQLKNTLLKRVEESFENEISDLLKAGTFSKYRDK